MKLKKHPKKIKSFAKKHDIFNSIKYRLDSSNIDGRLLNNYHLQVSNKYLRDVINNN